MRGPQAPPLESFAMPKRTDYSTLTKNAVEVLPDGGLERKLALGRPLRVKLGIDVTSPDIHVGRAIPLQRMRAFQDAGHTGVLIIGDYTTRIGDPSGRSNERPILSDEEIEQNARTYLEQAMVILDPDRTEVRRNGEWLSKLSYADVVGLARTTTVARILERDDFANRFAAQRPISVMEFLYPLMQAFDSVALKADVELGGSDQKFNLLVARTVQERYGQEPQVCLIMPLMRGTDGEQKMSKSYDNYIGITESAEQQFGKTMSIPDTLLAEWFRLATPLRGDALDAALADARTDPYRAKRSLARLIATAYHGGEAARAAEEQFDLLFRRHEVPEDMTELDLALDLPALRHEPDRGVWAPGLFVAAGLAASNSEATRLVDQGAVSIDGERVADRAAFIPVHPGSVLVLKRGKRQFARVRLT